MTIEFVQTTNLAAPPERVWQIIADTDRLNRDLGLPPVQLEASRTEPNTAVLEAKSRLPGQISLRWKEFPFEWEHGRYYRNVRRFTGPLIHEIMIRCDLEPCGDGTYLRFEVKAVPGSRLWGRFPPRDLTA